jgi:hypothetical protein
MEYELKLGQDVMGKSLSTPMRTIFEYNYVVEVH